MLIQNLLKRFDKKEIKGQGFAEYALLLSFIALAVVMALGNMGTQLVTFFTGIIDNL
ncbi:MAG: Flp family type IVb pilin [Clostridiales bacterium]|nr:Flp family type IVb pilin [Clostridiales bacterium]